MDRTRLDLRFPHSGSAQSEESALDLERNYFSHPNLPSSSPTPLQVFASSGQHSESSAAYFSWPTSSRLNDAAEDRANYFGNLQKGVLPETLDRLPTGQQATTLLELMTIRAFHSKILRRYSLGTAIGFRIQQGMLTEIPAILVFVARKVHRQWLNLSQCLPSALEGPGGVWCDVDVVEFSYYGAPAPTPKEQLYTELVDGLRGSDPWIGSGSQRLDRLKRQVMRRREMPKNEDRFDGDTFDCNLFNLAEDQEFEDEVEDELHDFEGNVVYNENAITNPMLIELSVLYCRCDSSNGPILLACAQVASQETYGTLGAIVKSRTGNRQVGFLTNRHVAVDLDYPNQKMFHPMPPSLGPGVYLGAVERATSFITDDLWYGIFAGTNPGKLLFLELIIDRLAPQICPLQFVEPAETFVRADGAFIPFADDFDIANVITSVKGVGEIGDVKIIDLQSPINSLIGKQVVKVGRSSGLTTGTVMAYALEYNDEKGICFFTDFLVVGENQQSFDLEGDSGSLILLTGQNGEKPQPIGIIWGGTANRGRLKLKVGQPPENWTSGVDLGRLLDLLELDLIITGEGLKGLCFWIDQSFFAVAVQEQRTASAAPVDSLVGESSPADGTPPKDKEDNFEPLGFNIQQIPVDGGSGPDLNPPFVHTEFHVEDGVHADLNVEHQFIPNLIGLSPVHQNHQQDNPELGNLSALRNGSDEDLCVSLQLGDCEPKRRRSDPSFSIEEPK
ncbi:hypothetical protein HHK36_004680 [Tetracentron sinense]|uniref:Trypsin family protein n=1 Tax=Tetracentron sinense TaxID=13715 RepID=A0A835DQF3_TETSI|nr:hypothetical protein HHK36_004680 [Tetracentron sinense]